jgi:hypothetical protein
MTRVRKICHVTEFMHVLHPIWHAILTLLIAQNLNWPKSRLGELGELQLETVANHAI